MGCKSRMSPHCIPIATATLLVSTLASSASADILEVGGSVVLREPPSSILLNEWESSEEIRCWFERQTVLENGVTLGHVVPGYVDTDTQLVGGLIPRGSFIQSHMVRLDPIASGPVTLDGFVRFDMPILGVLIGSQLGPTDSVLKKPTVTYNANSFRGLELDGPAGESDSFQISEDRRRIDFAMTVGNWTDDIRIVTFIPPACLGDINNDGVVSTSDLTLFLSTFGQDVIPGVGGDLNGDGSITTADLTRFLGRFGRPC